MNRAGYILAAFCTISAGACAQQPATAHYVDCGATKDSPRGTLHSLAEVNALKLAAGDTVLFKRGTTCRGVLHPQGSGREGAPIRIGTYGEGALPRIEAGTSDDTALQLFNQEYWEIGSLDISGGRMHGVLVSGDAGVMHHIDLRLLRVHDVRGPLKKKESGLIVISPVGKTASFEGIQLDGILASNTTQWAGIFVASATHVRITNSMVHDVQGDGIVAFGATDVLIAHSAAWHTGMQHQMTIGTPNAIWTWKCTDCIVEDNEAFLTDSPGVDGGGFDIDYFNIRNTVRRNFAHDTAGYCVSIFGALGPTTDSVVAGNLCLNNGLSPKLAQRQGAILLMTWQGGSIKGLDLRDNRVDWQPPGDTPAIQGGSALHAENVKISDNEISSTAATFVSPALKYIGAHNSFQPADPTRAAFEMKTVRTSGWKLVANIPASMLSGTSIDQVHPVLVSLKSAALQFGHAGLQVSLTSDGDLAAMAADWSLASEGILITSHSGQGSLSITLRSPQNKLIHEWHENPGAVALGLALRQTVGPPVFGRLDIEKVPATD